MVKKTHTDYLNQTVGHALDVLEQFHNNAGELGITELSKCLNLQKNKIFRLLATLEHHGYIEQDTATSCYRLGLKNLQLGQTFINQSGLLRHARPVLESLARRCQETSYVAILKDFDIIYLDSVETDHPVRVVTRVGKKLPFYCTAVGKVLAADMSEKNLQEFFKSAGFKQYTSCTINDPEELTRHLRSIAELGYAVDDEELDVGVKCVGAPIRDYTRRVVGAVSVSAPSVRFSSERMNTVLIPLIKDAAKELSSSLGYN